MSEAGAIAHVKEPLPPARHSGWRFLPLSAAVIVVDQLSKAWITARMALHESFTVLPVLEILRTHNTGAAWSFLAGAGGWQRWFFTALAFGISAGILWWLRRLDGRRQALQSLGLSLVLAGALGNAIDRMRFGYVVDFVGVHWNDAWFPAFNVADAAITIGAGLLLLDALLESRRR
jgi:signal peptidase II